MNSMDEKEKMKIIQSTNEIRKEIGLELLDVSYLENLSIEELEKIYKRQLALKENYRMGEKPKSKLIVGILVGIFIIVGFLFLSQFLFLEVIKIPFLWQPTGGSSVKISDASLGFMYNSGDYAHFIILNSGDKQLSSFDLLIDNQNKTYEITQGELPLSPKQYLYFKTPLIYDNEIHLVKVIINEKTIKEIKIKGNSTIQNATQPGFLIT